MLPIVGTPLLQSPEHELRVKKAKPHAREMFNIACDNISSGVCSTHKVLMYEELQSQHEN